MPMKQLTVIISNFMEIAVGVLIIFCAAVLAGGVCYIFYTNRNGSLTDRFSGIYLVSIL